MIKRIMLSCALLLAVPNCGAALKAVVEALPTVIQYVQDAQLILDQIDLAAEPILELKADEALQAKYRVAMDTARKSLQVALRMTRGGEELSQDKVNEAFSSFRDSYLQLTALLEQAGLMSPGGRMAAAPGVPVITVAQPLAMSTGQ